VQPDTWRRYLAPAAFLLAVTIAVVLIRAGMNAGSKQDSVTTTIAKVRKTPARFWTVRAGDTFVVISRQTGVPVRTIVRLNKGLSSTSLHIGQKVRLR
jgi:LysM repeat protein